MRALNGKLLPLFRHRPQDRVRRDRALAFLQALLDRVVGVILGLPLDSIMRASGEARSYQKKYFSANCMMRGSSEFLICPKSSRLVTSAVAAAPCVVGAAADAGTKFGLKGLKLLVTL